MGAALKRLQPWVTALQGPRLQSFSAAVRMATLFSMSACQLVLCASEAEEADEVEAPGTEVTEGGLGVVTAAA
jgi:hypothetical protein